MKASILLSVAAASVGLAKVLPAANTTRVNSGDVKPTPNVTASERGLYSDSWSDFRGPLNQDTACLTFRSLQWLSHALIEPSQQFDSAAGALVFLPAEEQGGPLVLVARALMIWTRVLDAFRLQLEATKNWHVEAQLRVAKCYLDYSFEAAAWLEQILPQACDFDYADPAKCLLYDKIEALYIVYSTVASILYGGIDGIQVQELIVDDFPEEIPPWFKTRFGAPQPGTSIRDYIAEFDRPLAEKLFQVNQQAWTCSSDWPWVGPPLCQDGVLVLTKEDAEE